MAEWSNELVLEFLERYAAEPLLYDPKHPYHKNKKMINKAWQRLQQKLGIAVMVSELKKKKDSLMASFRYQMRRRKEAMLIGETNFKPTWFAFDFMYGFLGQIYENEGVEDSMLQITLDICSTTMHSSQQRLPLFELLSAQLSKKQQEPVLEFVGFDALEEDLSTPSNHDNPPTPQELYIPEIKVEVIEEEDNPDPEPKEENKIEFKPKEQKQNHAHKRKHSPDTSVRETPSSSRNHDEDDCDLYGKLIAKKLRKLPETHRERLMYEIQGLFMKISQYRFNS